MTTTLTVTHLLCMNKYDLLTNNICLDCSLESLVFDMHHVCIVYILISLFLIQESEERVRRLRGQGGLSPVAGEDGCERYPILSPIMCPLSPGERSPRHPVPVIGMSAVALR